MAADFDGVSYLRKTTGIQPIPDGPRGTLAFWFRPDNATNFLLTGGPGLFSRITSFMVSGELFVILSNAAGTVVAGVSTGAILNPDGDYHHVACSWDLTQPTIQMAVDREIVTNITNPPQVDTVGYSVIDTWSLGASLSGISPLDGGMYDILFTPEVFVDLTDAEQLGRLISSDGLAGRLNPGPTPGPKPVGYGHDGSNPFGGVVPYINFGGAFVRNYGSGGDFETVGQIGQTGGPDSWRVESLWLTPGERWFQSDRSGFMYPKSRMFRDRDNGQRLGEDEVDDLDRDDIRELDFDSFVFEEEDREDIP